MGKDRQSWTYVRQIADMANELSQDKGSTNHNFHGPEATSNQAFAYAWWGLWIATT